MEGNEEPNGSDSHTSPPAKAATSPTSNVETTTEADSVKSEAEVKKEEEKSPESKEVKSEPVEKADEKDQVDEELNAKQKHQLNQRELFLSKQVEVLPATNIRGKCCVTLLNETESFSSYIDKEVVYFKEYCLNLNIRYSFVTFSGCIFLHFGV